MSFKKRATGTPEDVASAVAFWKETICNDASMARLSADNRRHQEAQCDAIVACLQRYTIALDARHVVDVIAEGHMQNENGGTMTITIMTAKRSEDLKKAATFDGRADGQAAK